MAEALLVLIGSGLVAAIIGKAKGSSFLLWFLIGFVLPVIGIIVALAYRSEHREPERRCPRCGKVQKLYVQVCNACGEDLFLPENAAEVRTPAMIEAARQAREP